jgi:hypothetical protein
VVTGSTEEEMAGSAKTARERIAFYASTPTYRPVLELHGWGDLQRDLNTLARQGKWAEMGDLIDDEVLANFALIAPTDQVPDALGRWVADCADRTSFSAPSDGDPEAVATQVAAIRDGAASAGRR